MVFATYQRMRAKGTSWAGTSPMSPGPSVNVNNPSARKSLHQFSEVLDVKKKTAICRLGAAN